MMTPTETGMLLTKIGTYDNRPLTTEAIDSWCESLKSYVTVDDAKQAVSDFYGDPRWAESARRPWIMPADINARCAKMRKIRLPDEKTIGDAIERMELRGEIGGGTESWDVRRLAIPLIQDGMALDDALKAAVGRMPKRLPAAKAKPSRPKQHHFVGNKLNQMNLNQVLGKEQ
jgi:hypothetical protein